MARCPKCDSPLTLDALYCGQCGTRIEKSQTDDSRNQMLVKNSYFAYSEYSLERQVTTEHSSFEIKDMNGNLVAVAIREAANFGDTIRVETLSGVQIGKIQLSAALVPNRPYVTVRDEDGHETAIIIMRTAKKPGSGFVSVGITSWFLARPDGADIAKIEWEKGGHKWVMKSSDDSVLADARWFKESRGTFYFQVLNPAVDPFFLLASAFGNEAARQYIF